MHTARLGHEALVVEPDERQVVGGGARRLGTRGAQRRAQVRDRVGHLRHPGDAQAVGRLERPQLQGNGRRCSAAMSGKAEAEQSLNPLYAGARLKMQEDF